MMNKFEIRKSSDDQHYFVLIAANGEVIATSEMYETKFAAENGIASVKMNAPLAKIVDVIVKSERLDQ